ncbi:GreA/GreB family elongation factor [Winogradskyella echinorum]|uniref:GreA/GreB family elongation factor n=1 Tax=Winogradskyella echinorum TaxID=538189 RepID=A0ABR6Y0Q7_9FLAO|nr:GreA/GreB family elongation factor [Winogradskyella echinorum]MBC3846331.1 GreA/GreB family elongation factor [Winogradskyella echinorum]MBC5750679.1 GreA/GreB family elongation factor [Winogradskyella echinorum]
MKYGSLILEKKEYVYLKRILNISGYAENHEIQKCLMKLSEELRTAHIADEEEMPKDVIRFNSIVTVAFNNGIEKTVQLVIPTNKDVKNNKISVLTPMGSALIGYSQEDAIIWNFPNGTQQITVKEVKQHETFSDMDIVI